MKGHAGCRHADSPSVRRILNYLTMVELGLNGAVIINSTVQLSSDLKLHTVPYELMGSRHVTTKVFKISNTIHNITMIMVNF